MLADYAVMREQARDGLRCRRQVAGKKGPRQRALKLSRAASDYIMPIPPIPLMSPMPPPALSFDGLSAIIASVVTSKPATEAEALSRIAAEIEAFAASDHRSLAVIARTQGRAEALHRALDKAGVAARLLTPQSMAFATGVVVCTAHLAKGLEFDRVIVPDVGAGAYRTEMDRNLLYVACTRAMHRLTLVAVGERSALLPAENGRSAEDAA